MAWSPSETPLTLPSSPSLLLNNLSAHNSELAYSRADEVVLVNTESGKARNVPFRGGGAKVFQSLFCTIKGLDLLVVGSASGVQICHLEGGPDGQIRIMFAFSLATLAERSKDAFLFARGIAAVQGGDEICVGCSSGEILVFEVKSGSSVELRHTLEGHSSSITALAASAQLLVSADDVGEIRAWDISSAFVETCVFPATGFPCTSIGVRDDVVIAGYSTGHVRIFRTRTNELVVEVAAHSRCINAIDVHPHQPLVVSAGEDTFVNVWSLPDFESKGSSEVSLLYSYCVKDQLLTGVQFSRDGTSSIATAAYDVDTATTLVRD